MTKRKILTANRITNAIEVMGSAQKNSLSNLIIARMNQVSIEKTALHIYIKKLITALAAIEISEIIIFPNNYDFLLLNISVILLNLTDKSK